MAVIWEGDDPGADKKITYRQLHEDVCKFANVLKSRGVKKGDRVSIYMPMVSEVVVAILACARIGAVHSIVFGGFSPESLKDRILDSDCRVVITADEGLRGARPVPLKANADKALESCPNVHTVVVVKCTGGDIAWHEERDVWYQELMAEASSDCPPEEMDAEDPLFILYTSGSTGKPKGVVHTTGGYILYAAMTHKYVFDCHDGDVYWCTADVGWVTGHSYVVYGPLANGATTLVFEGIPTYPDASRFWQVVDKHQVTIFYTAPTALRALMGQGNKLVEKTSRKSLKLLGTVGEPINPEAWEWYYHVIGEERCPIVDTWWQTETGGILITPLPGATTSSSPARRHCPSSALCRKSSMPKARCSRVRPKVTCASANPGPARCAPSSVTISASRRPISPPTRVSISPATARAAMPTAITGSRDGWTMSSTSRATAWAPPRWKARWCCTIRSPKPRSSVIPMRLKVRVYMPT